MDAFAAPAVVDAFAAGVCPQELEELRGALRVASLGFVRDDLVSAGRRFAELLSRSKCHSLSLGQEPTFVLFGPPYASGRYVLLPAGVTDRLGSKRGVDWLDPCRLPHLTVGRFEQGAGRVVGGGDALEWHVAFEPWPTERGLTWSRETRHVVPIRRLVDRMARELVDARCFERPLPCVAYWDEDEYCWVLVDGPGVEVYRAFRHALACHFADLGLTYAFEPWCRRRGVDRIHVTGFLDDSQPAAREVTAGEEV